MKNNSLINVYKKYKNKKNECFKLNKKKIFFSGLFGNKK